jgi:hypothetical protein
MTRVISEFDPGERPQLELVRNSREDSQDQLRRARRRLERAQRRVQDLEVADDSWMLLLAQYELALERNGCGGLMSPTGVLLEVSGTA